MKEVVCANAGSINGGASGTLRGPSLDFYFVWHPAGLAGKVGAGAVRPKAVPGTALRKLKGERNSRVRSPELPGCLASGRALCEVL